MMTNNSSNKTRNRVQTPSRKKSGKKTRMRKRNPLRLGNVAPLNLVNDIQKHGSVSTVIRGCDMVSEISSSDNFNSNITPYRINPGNPTLFPRLSQVAKVYEKYRFRKLKFLYLPIAAATVTGSVVYMMETDFVDLPPTTKSQMLNHYNSRRTSPWNEMELVVSAKDLHPRPQMFVREQSTLPGDVDPRLDDLGHLYIGSSADNSTALEPKIIGELWVEYDIELISPSVVSGTIPSAPPTYIVQALSPSGSTVPSLLGSLDLVNLPTVNTFGINAIVDTTNRIVEFEFPNPFEGAIDISMVGNNDAEFDESISLESSPEVSIRDLNLDYSMILDGLGTQPGRAVLKNVISTTGRLASNFVEKPFLKVLIPSLTAGLVTAINIILTPRYSSLVTASPPTGPLTFVSPPSTQTSSTLTPLPKARPTTATPRRVTQSCPSPFLPRPGGQ